MLTGRGTSELQLTPAFGPAVHQYATDLPGAVGTSGMIRLMPGRVGAMGKKAPLGAYRTGGHLEVITRFSRLRGRFGLYLVILENMNERALLYGEALIRLAVDLTPRQREMLGVLCEAPRNELSAGEIANIMGLPHHWPINLEAANLAKRLTEATQIDPPKRRDGSSRWWLVLFTGRYSREQRQRGFLWRLRPELRDAVIEARIADAPSMNLYPDTLNEPLSLSIAGSLRSR